MWSYNACCVIVYGRVTACSDIAGRVSVYHCITVSWFMICGAAGNGSKLGNLASRQSLARLSSLVTVTVPLTLLSSPSLHHHCPLRVPRVPSCLVEGRNCTERWQVGRPRQQVAVSRHRLSLTQADTIQCIDIHNIQRRKLLSISPSWNKLLPHYVHTQESVKTNGHWNDT